MVDKNSRNFAYSLNTFAFELYKHLVNSVPNRNLICSPISLQMCSGMLRMAAEDGCETAKELDEGLQFGLVKGQEIGNAFGQILMAYKECSALKMANKLYVMKGCQILKEFKDILGEKFRSQPENIDFSNGHVAARIINSWIETETNQLIKDAVNANSLGVDTQLVLVNAIHFKADWSVPFDEHATQNEDFHLENGNKIQVAMMNASHKYYYADLNEFNAKVLRMPYKGTNLFMLIVLPNERSGLSQLEDALQSVTLETITNQLNLRKVDLKLPKFKIEFELEFTPIFRLLGINRIFEGAEFSKILPNSGNMQVSMIYQKAIIEVNERGTEASAATVQMMAVRSLMLTDREPVEFHAEHPFFYIIYDEDHGCLFVGNLKDPLAGEGDAVAAKQTSCSCPDKESCDH